MSGFVPRRDTVPRRIPRPGGGPGRRFEWTVGLGLAVAVAVAAALAPTRTGPLLVLGVVGVAVVALALSRTATALVLIVVGSFVREALHSVDVPVPLPLLLLAVTLAGIGLAVSRGDLPAPTLGSVEVAMLLYLGWNVVSWATPHELDPLGPTSVALFVVSGVAFPIGLYVIGRVSGGSDRLVQVLLWTILAVTGYSVWLGVLEAYGPQALAWPRYVVESPSWPGRAAGIFNQPVTNGVLLVIGGAVAIHLALTTTGYRRVVAAIVAAGAGYTIYLTHTRAVWLAAVAVTVLAVGVRETRRAALGLLAVGALVASANWSTLLSADRAAGGVGSSNEVEDRLNMIATAWWAVGEHPWVGWGVARFQHLNVLYHQQWSATVDWKRGHGIASHENEMGIAAELGVIGLVLWLAVLVLLARRVVRLVARRAPGPERRLGLFAATALVTLVVVGTTVDLRYLDFAEGLVFLVIGVAVGRDEARPSAPGPDGDGDGDGEPAVEATAAPAPIPTGALR